MTPAITRAIEDALLTISLIEHRLPADKPPADASVAVGLHEFGPGTTFDDWRIWRALVRLRDAVDAEAPAASGTTPKTNA